MNNNSILVRIIMYSACHLKKFASLLMVAFFGSYILFADVIFSLLLLFLGFTYLILCFNFYLKHMNNAKDDLLDLLDEKGRKELQIEKDAETIKLFKKGPTCSLFRVTQNAKEFELTILYLGKEHITIYQGCPNSHIYKVYKKKPPGKLRPKPIQVCTKSFEYYYSYIQEAHFDDDIIITLNNGKEIALGAAKGPAKSTVIKIRKHLRKTEKNWVDHSRGSHTIKKG